MKIIIKLISPAAALMILCSSAFADNGNKKAVHISRFNTINISEVEGKQVVNLVSKYLIDTDKYVIINQSTLQAGLAQAEKQQALGCDGDKCMKALMKSSKVDYIVYGTYMLKNDITYLTIKMLDKSSGNIKLSKIRTVRFRNKKYIEESVKVLCGYIVSGKDKEVQEFQDKMNREEKIAEKKRLAGELNKTEEQQEKEYQERIDRFKNERRKSISSKHSLWRMGYSSWGMRAKNEEFNEYYNRGYLMMYDVIGSNITQNLDFYFRFTYKSFSKKDVTPPLESSPVSDLWELGDVMCMPMDLGLRYRFDMYMLMTRFDLYVLGALRYDMLNSAFGYYGGGGLEIAFYPGVGFFGEYNYGVLEIGKAKIDIEDSQFILGVTLRY